MKSFVMKLVVRLILSYILKKLESWVEETICDETSCCKVDFGLFFTKFRKLGQRNHLWWKLVVVRLILGYTLRNLESWVDEIICDETCCKVDDFGLFQKRFRKLG